MKSILVTGAAGFIGSYLVARLLEECDDATIVGVDNMNAYYDISLKKHRLQRIESIVADEHTTNKWHFIEGSIADRELIERAFATYKFDIVVNLAAQAGVRYSITNPDAYIESNIVGFYNILEACRHSYDNGERGVQHLVYASSSSVYGDNEKIPYSTDDTTRGSSSLCGMAQRVLRITKKSAYHENRRCRNRICGFEHRHATCPA